MRKGIIATLVDWILGLHWPIRIYLIMAALYLLPSNKYTTAVAIAMVIVILYNNLKKYFHTKPRR